MCDVSYHVIARKIGRDTTTLRRWLVRHGLFQTKTAKYVQVHEVPILTHPCMRCGAGKKRLQNLCMCGRCRAQITRIV
jgi:hypothetical protein